MGAPEKFSEDVVERILTGIRKGLPIKMAASLAGISYPALRQWIKQGEAGEDPRKVDFVERYRKAEAECAERCLEMIDAASLKQWQAAAWLLERRYSDVYGQRKAFEIQRSDDEEEGDDSDKWEKYPEEVRPPKK